MQIKFEGTNDFLNPIMIVYIAKQLAWWLLADASHMSHIKKVAIVGRKISSPRHLMVWLFNYVPISNASLYVKGYPLPH